MSGKISQSSHQGSPSLGVRSDTVVSILNGLTQKSPLKNNHQVNVRRSPPICISREYDQNWQCDNWLFVPSRGLVLNLEDLDEKPSVLTMMESCFLTVLLKYRGETSELPPVVRRDIFWTELWGNVLVEYDNQIDKLACRLRRKLKGRVVQVLRGRGIALAAQPKLAKLTPKLTKLLQ